MEQDESKSTLQSEQTEEVKEIQPSKENEQSSSSEAVFQRCSYNFDLPFFLTTISDIIICSSVVNWMNWYNKLQELKYWKVFMITRIGTW